MTVRYSVSCPVCGYDVKMSRLGLREDGSFDPVMVSHELSLRANNYGGRGVIVVERQPLPIHIAVGLRNALRYRLAQVEAELAAAGITEDAGQDAA